MRDAEQNRACAEQGDARNCIKNYCFRTLIFKLVNPLKSLEDISLYMNRLLHIPLVFYLFLFSEAAQYGLTVFPGVGFICVCYVTNPGSNSL